MRSAIWSILPAKNHFPKSVISTGEGSAGIDRTLYKDPMVALLPEGHKLAKRKTFSAKFAETEAYI